MRKESWRIAFVTLLAGGALALGAFGLSRASDTYQTDFQAQYPAAVGTRIDSCLICHNVANPGSSARNAYGAAWRANAYSFTAIEGLDSDGDGSTNKQEITALTFPGNAADFPAADTTSPTVTAFVLPATATSLYVPITSFGASDNVAVTGYLVTQTSSTPSAADIRWTLTPPTAYSFSTAGPKTLYAWAKDAAGNVSNSSPSAVTLTVTAPQLLWRNSTIGQNAIWNMDGINFISSGLLLTLNNTNWKIVGTGDFNYDGKRDILWRNSATGENAYWYMDGTNLIAGAVLPTVADLNWTIVGTGDFNYDGKTDILWRNTATGQNVVWYMNGTAIAGSAALLTLPDPNWKVVGTSDFNADGKPDIVWRNSANGQNAVWYMNGTTVNGQVLPTEADLNWTIVGTGDFNNDVKPDILWRNTSNGQNRVWYMDGLTNTGTAALLAVPDTNWKIVGF